MISQDHVTDCSRDFMSENSSLHATILPGLVVMGIAVVEIFLFCHMISQHHVI